MGRPRIRSDEYRVAYKREWRAEHPPPIEVRAAQFRKHNLKRWYGITPEDYEAMQIAQGGVCAICERPESMRTNRKGSDAIKDLAVDHDPATGEVRGLLCARCNVALGYLKHDPLLLDAAIRYLLK